MNQCSAFTQRQVMEDPYIELWHRYSADVISVKPHYHSHYEILFYLGEGLDYQVDSNLYHLQRGDLLLLPPYVTHHPIVRSEQKESTHERFVLWFSQEWWRSVSDITSEMEFCFNIVKTKQDYLLRTTQATWNGFVNYLQTICNQLEEKKICYQVVTRASVAVFMTHLNWTVFYKNTQKTTDEEHQELFHLVQGYIYTHLSEKITLEQTARELLVSKSTITNLFRDYFGVSFYQYVTERRLVAVKNNILSGIPISSAWENCGFFDYSTFYRSFKKEYGMSPREFKQKNLLPPGKLPAAF